MGSIRVLLMTLALLLCASPQTSSAEEEALATGSAQHRPYFEGWLRIDANLPLYQSNDPAGMRVGLIMSGHFAYNTPEVNGPRFTGFAGVSLSDHRVLFGLYAGGSLSNEVTEQSELPVRGVVGLRIGALLPHHIDLWHETTFFVRTNTAPEILSQTEILSPSFGPRNKLMLGIKNLIEGAVGSPHKDLRLLTGPQLSIWLLNDTRTDHTKKFHPKVRADAAYKIGPFWNENRMDVSHEFELELIYFFGT